MGFCRHTHICKECRCTAKTASYMHTQIHTDTQTTDMYTHTHTNTHSLRQYICSTGKWNIQQTQAWQQGSEIAHKTPDCNCFNLIQSLKYLLFLTLAVY